MSVLCVVCCSLHPSCHLGPDGIWQPGAKLISLKRYFFVFHRNEVLDILVLHYLSVKKLDERKSRKIQQQCTNWNSKLRSHMSMWYVVQIVEPTGCQHPTIRHCTHQLITLCVVDILCQKVKIQS